MRTMTLFAAATIALSACAGRTGAGSSENDVVIEFNNQSTEQATLYVVPFSGEEVRLGTAIGGRSETFRVPESIAMRGSVTFAARILARGEAPNTGPVSIRPGDRYRITLPPTRGALTVLPGR